MKQLIGACMIALPLLAMFAATVRASGWRVALSMWVIAIVGTALIAVGVKLMVEGP